MAQSNEERQKALDEAIALVGKGYTVRKASELTGVSKSAIDRAIQKSGTVSRGTAGQEAENSGTAQIKKGQLIELADEKFQVDKKMSELTPRQAWAVNEIVSRKVLAEDRLNDLALYNLSFLEKKIDEDSDLTDHLQFAKVLSESRNGLGIPLPKEPAVTINNTNAQQNNTPQLSEAELDAIFNQMRGN
jgi:transposase